MRKYTLPLLILSFYGHASCYDHSPTRVVAPPVSITIPDFNGQKSVTTSFTTQYSGPYTCKWGGIIFPGSYISYSNLFGGNQKPVVGFYNGKYFIQMSIDHNSRDFYKQSEGNHNASELNRSFPITFTLVNSSSSQNITPDGTFKFKDSIIVSDTSGMTVVTWFLKFLEKIVIWLFNGFHWPYDQRDMFSQPLIINFNPKKTTCIFKSPPTVNLPTVGLYELRNTNRPGYTPFTIDMLCQGTINNQSDRPLKVFLSSSKLLPSDNRVLTDKNIDGVGISLTSNGSSNAIHMSDSPMNIGPATVILDIKEGSKLNPTTPLQFGAYYVSTNKSPKAGVINTDAVINVLYE